MIRIEADIFLTNGKFWRIVTDQSEDRKIVQSQVIKFHNI